MNRRGFLGRLGLGVAAIAVSPLLMSNDIHINDITEVPEDLIKPGQFGSSFKINLSEDMFQPNDVITVDPEYGQQFMICGKDHPEYDVKLMTNDKNEFATAGSTQKGREVFQIRHTGGEYEPSTPYMGLHILEVNGLDGSFQYDVKKCYII